MQNEAHIFNALNGHLMSTDCWCEPTDMAWQRNDHGVKVYVVWHEDIIDPRIHHSLVIEARDESPDDWISHVLESAFHKEHHDGQNDE
jgi:hypothetical protein